MLSKLFIRRINESVSLLSFSFGVSCIGTLVDAYPVADDDDMLDILFDKGENGVKWDNWSACDDKPPSTVCDWLYFTWLFKSERVNNKFVCCELHALSESNGDWDCDDDDDGVGIRDDGIDMFDSVFTSNDLWSFARMLLLSYFCDLSSCCLSFHIYCFRFSARTVARSASHSACVGWCSSNEHWLELFNVVAIMSTD